MWCVIKTKRPQRQNFIINNKCNNSSHIPSYHNQDKQIKDLECPNCQELSAQVVQLKEALLKATKLQLKTASQRYTIPRWQNQPHVQVCIEKQALADIFASFLRDRGVHIAVSKGYSGWSFLYNNCMRLQQIINDSGEQIHILYFGDLDSLIYRVYLN